MRTRRLISALGFFIALGAGARAEEPGNAAAGHAYAAKACAECHSIEAGEPYSANPDAPSFQSVANTPGMTGRALIVWLQSPHPTMPNLMVPEDERDNVVAYILSLATQKQ